MLNKISLSLLAATGALLSGVATMPAFAETATQTSTYDFKAVYGGQQLHNYVNDLSSGALQQNDWLNSVKKNETSSNSSTYIRKDESGEASTVKSGLSMPAIPGTNYGVVDVGGVKASHSSSSTVIAKQSDNASGLSSINQNSGINKSFQNTSTHQQDAVSHNFGEGSFKAGQNAFSSPYSYFGGF